MVQIQYTLMYKRVGRHSKGVPLIPHLRQDNETYTAADPTAIHTLYTKPCLLKGYRLFVISMPCHTLILLLTNEKFTLFHVQY